MSITNSTLEIKKELDNILKNIKAYSEKLTDTIEDGIPLENLNWIKREIWDLQVRGDLNKEKFDNIFKKANNESIFSS